MKILESLPGSMSLGDAMVEARRQAHEREAAAQRVREEMYRESHREDRNRQSRECKARRRERLKLQEALTGVTMEKYMVDRK